MSTGTIPTCAFCGDSIDHLRRQAKFCSARCRCLHFRGEPYLPAGICESCGATLLGTRVDARFCGPSCRSRAWRASKLTGLATATNGFHPPSKGIMPGAGTDACTRCGSSASYSDQDGDHYCFMCGREAA